MSRTPRRWLALGCVLAIVGLTPAAATADGDPASDVLLTESMFLPFAPQVSASLAGALAQTISRAHAAGYPIKVALIESPTDLGADPELFGTPERYARFLDTEITYNAAPPLLVVMPQGAGTAATVAADALTGVKIDLAARSDGLARAAISDVVTLARRSGHPIAAPRIPGAAGASGAGVPLWLVAGAGAIIALGALACVRRWRRTERR